MPVLRTFSPGLMALSCGSESRLAYCTSTDSTLGSGARLGAPDELPVDVHRDVRVVGEAALVEEAVVVVLRVGRAARVADGELVERRRLARVELPAR